MSSREVTSRLREKVWNGSVPLEIRLHKGDCRTYDDSDAYLIQFPRLSYLALIIHKLHAFFAPSLIYPDIHPSDLWFSYEGVPLKWHYPLGLLYDLYSGAEPYHPSDSPPPSPTTPSKQDSKQPLPWRLTLHTSAYPTTQLIPLDNNNLQIHDLFIHSVKEADYLRTGTGKTVMFLSQADSTQLWDAVVKHDFALFNPINQKLLNPQGVNLRHLPVRLYLPHAGVDEEDRGMGSVRVVQSLVKVEVGSRQPQTIGTALNQILPTLFPSRRSALLAQAVLHGAVVPLGASVEELIRSVAYLDGWLHIAIVMMG
ncbi:autophagy protein 5 [Parastagonospora nodorum]|nr:autophagy protein 5 [Parastagonospora nodorum]KAH4167333.1 autophagy protein 5 [Parastagonospora nodorum]KAH4205438.1 autophagy protein 5 [Parastagonospora nodorum]KAH4219575.1 autophagy protein 5 [Parastagonospora nodorum]KAH4240856.1 autophagy protein 5 [Parastagonospora nodorum]